MWRPYAPMPATGTVRPVVEADGVRLRLADGRELIDGMSSWWAVIHGYRHPAITAAVRRQLDTLPHVMLGGLTHPQVVELAERLVAITPEPLTRVFFSDSGSVAVEVALKMALQHWMGRGRPERRRIITVRGGYHGDTFAAMSVCDPVTGMHHLFRGAMPEQFFGPLPDPPWGRPWDPSALEAMAEVVDRHAGEAAAVIVEPVVQGAGGMRFYHPGFLAGLRDLCDRHDLLLVADEIATGFGRSGELFGCGHAGVVPDIMCLGKALTGGYLSMAATLCTDEVAAGVSAAGSGALMHGPTFMGNALGAAAANASIEALLSRDWPAEVAAVQRGLEAGLAPAAGLPGVADVRVLGAIGVVETEAPLDLDAVQDVLVRQGVWLRPFGRLLYTMPPFVTGPEDVDAIAAAMVTALREVPAVAGAPPAPR